METLHQSIFLSTKELYLLTCKIKFKSQVKVLNQMGINHAIRPDGSVVVLRSHVESKLGTERKTRLSSFEPNWDALNAKAT